MNKDMYINDVVAPPSKRLQLLLPAKLYARVDKAADDIGVRLNHLVIIALTLQLQQFEKEGYNMPQINQIVNSQKVIPGHLEGPNSSEWEDPFSLD